MSTKTSGRVVGALILLAFVLYGTGSALGDGGDNQRLVSAVFLLMVPLGQVAREGSEYAYWFAMTGLAFGSVLLCRVLLQAHLVPRFLAVWGMVGYAVLAAGGMLEILGYGVGLALSAPGGLFELVVGVLLVVKGFPSAQVEDLDARALDLSLEPVAS